MAYQKFGRFCRNFHEEVEDEYGNDHRSVLLGMAYNFQKDFINELILELENAINKGEEQDLLSISKKSPYPIFLKKEKLLNELNLLVAILNLRMVIDESKFEDYEDIVKKNLK